MIRLSRPALSQRFPLPLPPKSSTAYINPNVALDLKTRETDDEFIFDPVVRIHSSRLFNRYSFHFLAYTTTSFWICLRWGIVLLHIMREQ